MRKISWLWPSARALFVGAPLLGASACYVGVDGSENQAGVSDGEDSGGEDSAGPGAVSLPGDEEAFPDVAGTPALMYLDTPEGVVEVEYLHLDNGYGVLDGDMVLYTPEDAQPLLGGRLLDELTWGEGEGEIAQAGEFGYEQRPQAGSVSNRIGRRWHNREILWEYDPDPNRTPPMGSNVRTAFAQAIVDLEAAVDVDFVQYDPMVHAADADRIQVREGTGCWSQVGRVGGPQSLSLSQNCTQNGAPGSAIHELAHAIGVWHEQSRNDRNANISVELSNVIGGREHNFNINPGDDIDAYNLSSIMHYSSCAFSRCDDPMVPMSTRCLDANNNECGFSHRNINRCMHCNCVNANNTCEYPSILDSNSGRITSQRTMLEPSDINAIEYILGCPGGANGNYCGGPLGLDETILYTCTDGDYAQSDDCGGGTCVVRPPGQNDYCTPAQQCPSGDGWYCGQGVGLTPDLLYWCQGGVFATLMPAPISCGWGDCVVAPAGKNDHCLDDSPPPTPDPNAECVSGPCCVNGSFAPGTVCASDVESQYGCPWGANAGSDVGVQFRDRTCSGVSSSCDGPLGAWGPWETADVCANDEYCSPGDATCNNAPPQTECVNGACCDPDGFFRPPGYVCDASADSEYGCPWGTGLGDDVGIRYREQTCSGASAACDGPLSAWDPWQTQDACSAAEMCEPGDPTCNPCAANYWTPTSTSDAQWDSQMAAELEIQKQEVSGDVVRVRVCKAGGVFNNNIDLDYEEWGKYNGWFMHSGSVQSMGSQCSQWVNLDTSSWNEGEIIGAQIRVVSPASCAEMWDDSCDVNPGCGNCWYWLSDTVMERTCL